MHSNLRLLTHKSDEYKEGAAKLWDVEPESTDFDLPIGAPALPMEDLSSQHIFSASSCGVQLSNVSMLMTILLLMMIHMVLISELISDF